MKNKFLLALVLLIAGCASYAPTRGMTTKEFDRMCRLSFNGASEVVNWDSSGQYRRCESKSDFVWLFVDDRLSNRATFSGPKSTSSTAGDKLGNAGMATAICSVLTGGKAAGCAAGALDSKDSNADKKIREQNQVIENLKRQQSIDKMKQEAKDRDREYDKRREDLNKWRPGQK
jgi:hypothetical protein